MGELVNEFTNSLTNLPTDPFTNSCLCEQPRESRLADRVAGEHLARILQAQVPADDFAEDVPEVGGDRQVAAVVALVHRQPRPSPVDAAAANAAADDHHRV